ncbi:MAG: hypothetical protein ACREMY_11670, partial [bacterium]
MTPQRRRLVASFLALGLVLAVAVGIVLATSMSAKPTFGPRDDGNASTPNPTQVTVSGTLDAPSGSPFSAPHAYWDAANESSPTSAYEIAIVGSPAINADGTFNFKVEVPWYDHNTDPVRPGNHRITICATTGSVAAILRCASDDFRVVKGTAVLSKTSGRQGDALTISGAHWVPEPVDEGIRITWAPGGATQQELLTSDEFGPSTWTKTVTIPSVPAGTYNIRICSVDNSNGNCAPLDAVVRPFTILTPKLILSQNSGLTGQQFTYQGQIFLPSRAVKIYFGPQGATIPGGAGVHDIT